MKKMGHTQRIAKPLLFLSAFALCFIAAGVGSFFTFAAIPTWYTGLTKPLFTPPNWLFGPVWTVLYSCMAVSLYLSWTSTKRVQQRRKGELYFYLQLMCNTLWSIIFFGMRNPAAALGVIVALWLLIFFTIREFIRINRVTVFLLTPYLLWVSFAAVLNLFIVLLN